MKIIHAIGGKEHVNIQFLKVYSNYGKNGSSQWPKEERISLTNHLQQTATNQQI
ncbi:hypothetical protein QJS10_CPB12g00871 [Acorus calamus]|uniref:Uncharacterized protein n=1 Tax=Acorus calamus TaxID=4465 RepID=A0AAV9DM10_ACOCL|nr:hypothetical protein QJS10_CPB12g00871 [Acorus calamus]